MDYFSIYHRLVERARHRSVDAYVERHHVLPRCMGGTDEKHNLVSLTPEEHFFVHLLLVKMHPEIPGLIAAVAMMAVGHEGRRARKMYGWLRRRHAAYMSALQAGNGNSGYGLKWISDGVAQQRISKNDFPPAGWYFGRPRKVKTEKPKGPGRGFKKTALSQRADAAELLRRYESGEKTEALGKEFGVSGKAIIQFLNSVYPQRRKFAPRTKRAPVV